MKNFIQNISKKWIIWGGVSVLCLIVFGGMLIAENVMQSKLYDQQMASRWSKEGDAAQISAFYSGAEVQDVTYFGGIEQAIEKALQQAAITTENENARLWIDAISRSGKITLSSERASIELKAIGVSGEFFQFHPQKLLYGSLFRGDSMMQDGIVIDKETAWQLFGSSDVAGMQVMIGQVPHYITGVIERPTGKIHKAAGLEKSICYVSMESLERCGIPNGGFTYEIVMPNPIQNFAYSALQTAVGTGNENVILVENSSRFQALSMLKIIQQFGTRSMSFKEIVFPYWENVARGYEDIFAVLFIVKSIVLIVLGSFFFAVIVACWKRKTWTLENGITWMKDALYEKSAQRAKKKQKRAPRKRGGKE